jgi:uncharacterized protein HemX
MSDREGMGVGSTLLHIGVTLVVAFAAARLVVSDGGIQVAISGPQASSLVLTVVLAASAALYAWRRRRASAGLTTGQMLAQRQAELERREADVDAVHARLAELEERLDFSERMLAQGRSPEAQRGEGAR